MAPKGMMFGLTRLLFQFAKSHAASCEWLHVVVGSVLFFWSPSQSGAGSLHAAPPNVAAVHVENGLAVALYALVEGVPVGTSGGRLARILSAMSLTRITAWLRT